MVNPTGKKLEKLLFGIFDEAIQGVDTYNHNGRSRQLSELHKESD